MTSQVKKQQVLIPVPLKSYKRWKSLYSHGDFTEIAKMYGQEGGFAVHNVQRAFRERRGSDVILKAIERYYDHKVKFFKKETSKIFN